MCCCATRRTSLLARRRLQAIEGDRGDGGLVRGARGRPFRQDFDVELILHGRFKTLDLARFGYERIATKTPLKELAVV